MRWLQFTIRAAGLAGVLAAILVGAAVAVGEWRGGSQIILNWLTATRDPQQMTYYDLDSRIRLRYAGVPVNLRWVEWTTPDSLLLYHTRASNTTTYTLSLTSGQLDTLQAYNRIISDYRDTGGPRWRDAPDGRHVAMVIGDGGNLDVFVSVVGEQSGNGAIQQLTDTPTPESVHSWSPGGDAFIYTRTEAGQMRYMLVTVADAPVADWPVRPLTDAPTQTVAWSPDGTRIAYISQDATGAWGLVIKNRDDSTIEVVALPQSRTYSSLLWSADGMRLVYTTSTLDDRRDISSPGHIYRVDLMTDSVTRLTDTENVYWGLNWSPDGAYMVFQGESQFGLGDLYAIADRPGARPIHIQTNVVNPPPVWRP